VAVADMIGVAAGLAAEGKIPFCASFTCFASRRAYDQITSSVAYARNNVKIVGTSPGVTAGANGGTHMCFQDLAIMRAMPGMHVYSPCDAAELRAAMRHMAGNTQPTYMQLIRSKVAKVFEEGVTFDPNAATVLREGHDVTLVSTGYATHLAIQAARALSERGIRAELLHYGSA
jgi:transketolase